METSGSFRCCRGGWGRWWRGWWGEGVDAVFFDDLLQAHEALGRGVGDEDGGGVRGCGYERSGLASWEEKGGDGEEEGGGGRGLPGVEGAANALAAGVEGGGDRVECGPCGLQGFEGLFEFEVHFVWFGHGFSNRVRIWSRAMV